MKWKFWKTEVRDYNLADTDFYIINKDKSVLTIRYPKNCTYTRQTIGDYCWGLAVAHEENNVDEFVAKHCPCEFI